MHSFLTVVYVKIQNKYGTTTLVWCSCLYCLSHFCIETVDIRTEVCSLETGNDAIFQGLDVKMEIKFPYTPLKIKRS